MKTRIVFAMTVCLMLFGLNAISYANLFVLIPDIPGESRDSNHLGWIEGLSSSWGHAQAPPGATVKGPQFSHLAIAKEIDSNSPALALFAADARLLPEVRLEFTTNIADQRVVYLKIRLRNSRIVSYKASGTGNNSASGTEELGLTFGQISWTTIRYDSNARPIPGGSAACWDLINNGSKCQP